MTDAAFQQEHGAGLEVMAGNLSQAESLIRLGETMQEAFGPDMPDSVLAALGYVALQLGEARAGESRWHAEARESTRLLHASNNVRAALNRELGEAREAHAEALSEALILAAESDERGALLRELYAARLLGPRDTARVGRLLDEAPAARRARLLRELAGAGRIKESGND
jgi:hypothetical protein